MNSQTEDTGTTSPPSSGQEGSEHLRLIDDAHHIQPSNSPSILRGLALSIIEVGWHRNNSMCNLRSTRYKFVTERKAQLLSNHSNAGNKQPIALNR